MSPECLYCNNELNPLDIRLTGYNVWTHQCIRCAVYYNYYFSIDDQNPLFIENMRFTINDIYFADYDFDKLEFFSTIALDKKAVQTSIDWANLQIKVDISATPIGNNQFRLGAYFIASKSVNDEELVIYINKYRQKPGGLEILALFS
jgi:hypothetical protein